MMMIIIIIIIVVAVEAAKVVVVIVVVIVVVNDFTSTVDHHVYSSRWKCNEFRFVFIRGFPERSHRPTV